MGPGGFCKHPRAIGANRQPRGPVQALWRGTSQPHPLLAWQTPQPVSNCPPLHAKSRPAQLKSFGSAIWELISTTTTININHMHSYRDSGMTIRTFDTYYMTTTTHTPAIHLIRMKKTHKTHANTTQAPSVDGRSTVYKEGSIGDHRDHCRPTDMSNMGSSR